MLTPMVAADSEAQESDSSSQEQSRLVARESRTRSEIARSPWRVTQLGLKRAVDFVGAMVGFTLLSPILLIVAVIIRHNSAGPVFFRQQRIGRHGKIFVMYKFRTMVVDAEHRQKDLEALNESEGGGLFKIRHDPRITRIGIFLRKTSLDELPQLVNVLIGEMSLVGPRPLPIRDCECLKSINPEGYQRRLEVVPGITGSWQVAGRSRIGAEKMLELDGQYVDDWSFAKDIILLIRTVKVLIFDGGGAF